MRLVVFATLREAEDAQAIEDRAAGLPRVHAEGFGDHKFNIGFPGSAAARLRARGVRTEHRYPIVVSDDGTRFALLMPNDARAIDVDPSEWFRRPRSH